MVEYTLGKKERLNSKTLIERLFSGGSKSFPAFPLRVVYMSVEPVEEDMAAASILISVPKKRFKRAVKRNLVKRQAATAMTFSICGAILQQFSINQRAGIDNHLSLL